MALPIGTFINIAAVLIGGGIGLLIRHSLPEKYKQIFFQGTGLFTMVLGISMAMAMPDPLIVIFAVIIGGVIGTYIGLGNQLEKLSGVVKRRLKIGDSKFSEGLITAFLIYCIGSMTIIGAINEGVSGDKGLLLTKSVLDGFTSIALASTFGVGVLFSVIPMLIFQGGLTLLAALVGDFFSEKLIQFLSAVGGLLILGIGINLLELRKIDVIDLLPALLVVIPLALALA